MPKDRQYVQLSIYLATGGPTKEKRTHVQSDGLCICVLVFVFVYFNLYMCIWQLANQQKKTGPMFKNTDCVEIH